MAIQLGNRNASNGPSVTNNGLYKLTLNILKTVDKDSKLSGTSILSFKIFLCILFNDNVKYFAFLLLVISLI